MAKGKAKTSYELGVKVSIATTLKEGSVVAAQSMPGNPYDGRTLRRALEQAAILPDVKPEMAFVDRSIAAWRSTVCKSGDQAETWCHARPEGDNQPAQCN